MRFAIRAQGSQDLKILNIEDDDKARARISEYLSTDTPARAYRIVVRTDGDILLKRLRIKPGSEVTEVRVIDVELEDEV